MSSAAVYDVVLRLSTTGSLSSGLDQIGGKANAADGHVDRLGKHGRELTEVFSRAGERVGGMLEGIADKALDIGEHFAKIGIGAAVALATYGVVHLNQELETTQISLGAIAQAQGFASTFEKGFMLAGDQLSKMKQDVKTLPGDLGQLSNIMKMIATPAAAGGANLDQIRQLAGKTMLTAGILGVPQDVAAREMAGLLAGRAGSHNILGGRLGLIGDEAKKFNEESPEKRLATINTEMAKYQGAADKFGQSFVANWTTLKDNIKYTLLAPATSPLFESVKRDIAEINTFFDEHKEKIDAIVFKVGDQLAAGWDRVHEIVVKIAPVVEKIVDKIANVNQANAFKSLEHAGELTLGVKAAGMGISAASSALPGAFRLGSMVGDMIGGGAAAGGAEAGGAAIGGAAGITTLGLGLVALATAATTAAGAVDILTDNTNSLHGSAMVAARDIEYHTTSAFEKLKTDAEPLGSAIRSVADAMGWLAIQAVDMKISEYANVATGIDKIGAAIYKLAVRLHLIAPTLGPDGELKIGTERELPPGIGTKHLAPNEPMNETGAKVPKVQVTNHNTIQINVTSNDPSRLARLVMTEIEKTTPVKSKFAPQYDQSSHY